MQMRLVLGPSCMAGAPHRREDREARRLDGVGSADAVAGQRGCPLLLMGPPPHEHRDARCTCTDRS
jgi:hypothetical protein